MTRVLVADSMMVSAVRYALGRATYIVSWTCEEVREVWQFMNPNTRTVIERDLREYLRLLPEPRSTLVAMDDEQWRRLLDWIDMQRKPGKLATSSEHANPLATIEETR